MGKSKADERSYWTLEEFQKFSDAIMDKQDSWIAFQILFWTGMRIGELLALQMKDIDFEQGTRLFAGRTKSFFEHEMERGIKMSGVKKITVHCTRHSHASMLVQMGFSPVEIAKRLGHGKVTTTIETYCHQSMDA